MNVGVRMEMDCSLEVGEKGEASVDVQMSFDLKEGRLSVMMDETTVSIYKVTFSQAKLSPQPSKISVVNISKPSKHASVSFQLIGHYTSDNSLILQCNIVNDWQGKTEEPVLIVLSIQ